MGPNRVFSFMRQQNPNAWVVRLAVLSLLANGLLVAIVFGGMAFRSADQNRWTRQSILVLEWLDHLETQKVPMAEFQRFAGADRDLMHWGPNYHDVCTVRVEPGPDGRIESISVDGERPAVFAELMRRRLEH